MSKNIDTLVEDIYSLFEDGHVTSEDNVKNLADNIAKSISFALKKAGETRSNHLRFSNLGHPVRKLWYKTKGYEGEELLPHTKIKFLYGDILEHLLIFLAKEAGHKVTGEQERLTLHDVVGHRDCVIDGVTVDAKTASKYAFENKFKPDLALLEEDSFGYLAQLSAYIEADETDEVSNTEGAFLVINKETGSLHLSKYPKEVLPSPKENIPKLKTILESEQLPERCYNPEPMGKSGNMKLPFQCSYCEFKHECYKDSNSGEGLRTFLYSSGPVYLTEVGKEPNVFELK